MYSFPLPYLARKLLESLTSIVSLRPRIALTSSSPSDLAASASSVIPSSTFLRTLQRSLPRDPTPGWSGTLSHSRDFALIDNTTIRAPQNAMPQTAGTSAGGAASSVAGGPQQPPAAPNYSSYATGVGTYSPAGYRPLAGSGVGVAAPNYATYASSRPSGSGPAVPYTPGGARPAQTSYYSPGGMYQPGAGSYYSTPMTHSQQYPYQTTTLSASTPGGGQPRTGGIGAIPNLAGGGTPKSSPAANGYMTMALPWNTNAGVQTNGTAAVGAGYGLPPHLRRTGTGPGTGGSASPLGAGSPSPYAYAGAKPGTPQRPQSPATWGH